MRTLRLPTERARVGAGAALGSCVLLLFSWACSSPEGRAAPPLTNTAGSGGVSGAAGQTAFAGASGGGGASAGQGAGTSSSGAGGAAGGGGNGGMAGAAGSGAGVGNTVEHFESSALQARTWSTLTAQGMPTARSESTVAAVLGKVFTFGARGKRPMNAFDPITKQWSEVAAPPVEMHHIQAVVLDDEIWVVGAFQGNYPDETSLGKAYRYDVKANQWNEGPSIARPRGSNAAVTYQGKLYMVCGSNGGHKGGFQAWFDSYDPKTQKWEQLADAPRPRDHIQGAVIGDKLYIAGGRTTSTGHDVELTVPEVDVYDFTAAKWSTLVAKLPTPRGDAATVAVGDWLLVVGGESSMPAAHAEVEGLNTLDGTFTSFSKLVQARHSTGAAWLAGKLYSAQGAGAQGGGPELTSIEVWQ